MVYEMISGKKTRRKIVVFSIVVGSVLTAFFVATIIYLIVCPPAYERPLFMMQKAVNTRSVSKFWRINLKLSDTLTALGLFEDSPKNDDYAKDYREVYGEYMEDLWEHLEDEFGDDVKMTYEVKKEKDLKNSDLRDMRTYYENNWLVDGDLIKEGKELEVKVRIKGSDDKETINVNMTVIKIHGKWYLEQSFSRTTDFINILESRYDLFEEYQDSFPNAWDYY